jgi:uncharacterized protein involved in exopolysaccharide biosynthesis
MYTETKLHSTSLRDFLHVIFKRKTQIILFFFITVCSVAVITFTATPIYNANSEVLVKIGRENFYTPTLPTRGDLNPVFTFDRDGLINSEIQILKSRLLATKVVKSLGPRIIYNDLTDDQKLHVKTAQERLRRDLTIKAIKKSNVIDVSFKHEDPTIAAMVVDTLIHLYLDHHLKVYKNPESYDFFQKQSQTLKNKLEQSEKRLAVFKRENDVTSLDEESSLLLRQIADLSTAYNQALSREAETENRIHQLRRQLVATPKTVSLDSSIGQATQVISTLKARLVELDLELSKHNTRSPLAQNIRDEIATVQKKLAEEENQRYGSSRSGLNTVYLNLQQNFYSNVVELKALRARKNTQLTHLTDQQRRLEKLNLIETDLNRIEQELQVDRENYLLYLSKFEESRISNAMDKERMTNVSQMEPALAPISPVSPQKRLNMAIAVFLGAFGGVALAFFTEYLDESLENPEDVEKHLQLPVLASIPIIAKQ